MKWKVLIPEPKAKRLVKRKLIILCYSGWENDKPQVVDLSSDVKEFNFEMNDDRHWAGNTSVMDGPVFRVELEYSNESGSRTERLQLIPEKENG